MRCSGKLQALEERVQVLAGRCQDLCPASAPRHHSRHIIVRHPPLAGSVMAPAEQALYSTLRCIREAQRCVTRATGGSAQLPDPFGEPESENLPVNACNLVVSLACCATRAHTAVDPQARAIAPLSWSLFT